MLATAVAAISGCGGGSGGDTVSLTRAELIKRGDAICEKVPQRYEARLLKLSKKERGKGSSGPPSEDLIAEAAVPPLRAAVAELQELGAPAGDEEEVEAIVAALAKGADGVERNPGGELGGPNSPFGEVDKLAKAYGFKVCSGF